jgi:hypothetical protein
MRNKTELRLREKPSKRNIKWSEDELKKCYKDNRLNSIDGEVKESNYLRINNTNLSPQEVATRIKEKFKL